MYLKKKSLNIFLVFNAMLVLPVGMDDTGNSSALDISEGALVVDLSHCTDDSQLADTSRCSVDDSRLTETHTADDSKERSGPGGITSSSKDLPQKTETNPCEKSACTNSDSCGTEGEKSNHGTDPKEEAATHRKLHEAQTYTPQKAMNAVLQRGTEEPQRSKYTPQKVDHRLAQLAVNAYISPSNRGGSPETDRGDPTDKEQSSAGQNVGADKSHLETSHSAGPSAPPNTFPGRSSVVTTNQNLKHSHVQIQQELISNAQKTKESDFDHSRGEHPSSSEVAQPTTTSYAMNSMSHRQEPTPTNIVQEKKKNPSQADLYSQEMSRLYSNMKQKENTLDGRSPPEDDDEEEEMEDMNETCDQSDLSKMEDEMEISQVEERELVQLQTTDVHCAACNNWFMNMNSYTLHMPRHAQMGSPLLGLKCEICKKSYLYELEFKAHVQAHLERQKVYKCRVCLKPFHEKSELQRHAKIHQDKKEFSCQFCGKEFHYTFNLKKHLRTHTGEKPYTCVLCELKFTHKNSLNRHMSVHTDDNKVECCVCDKVCPDRWTLQKHLASHQILHCPQCEQYFTNSRELQQHRKSHKVMENSAPDIPQTHNTNQAKPSDLAQPSTENMKPADLPQKPKAKRNRRSAETQCEICQKVFKNPGNYYRHLQSKEGMPIQTCDLCGHQFHDVYDLLKHTRQVHSQTVDTKGYSCRVCGQSFPDLALLTEHMSEHLQSMKKSGSALPIKEEEPLPHFCSVCGKQFLNVMLLELHMIEHSSSQGAVNVLDLSKTKDSVSQPPPRKRLKLESVDTAESHEYYDSDKENEPLNLSKKTYSPKAKPKILGVHQPRGHSSLASISTVPSVTSHISPHLSHKPVASSDPGPVGLDLSCRSKVSETSQNIAAENQTQKKGESINASDQFLEKSAMEDRSETTVKENLELDGVVPLKSSPVGTSVTMDTTHDDSPDENSNLTDRSDHLDQLPDLGSRTGSPSSLTCEYCTKTFSDPVTLNRHLSSHYKEWAFYCNYCNTMFTEEVSYRAHTPIHPSHTPYMCNVCSTHFSDRISLGAHLSQAHPQEKPFQCGVCQRRFPVKSYLGSHCRTHLTERPFKCNICERTFVHNFNLTKHMRTHTGEKPYTCAWCDRKFSQKNSLNR